MFRRAPRPWRLHQAIGTSAAAFLLLSGCFIEERQYDPALVDPRGVMAGALDAPSTAECEAYCSAVQSNCTGQYQVYLNTADCMRMCALMPAGDDLADPIGTNTVACRQRNAELATSEKDAYCPAAGPGGADRCGSNCEAYCRLRGQLCAGVSGQDVDQTKCMEQCPAVYDGVPYRPDPRTTGDSLSCRINHLVNASQSPTDAERHCWHTSVAPDVQMPSPSPCADAPDTPGNCDAYCELVMFSCTDDYQQYDSIGQCQAVCRALPFGKASDLGDGPGENTVGCRRYHSTAALNDPLYHCPHAGPMGDGHCGERFGNNCQSYCRILKRACTARFYAEYLPGTAAPDTLPDNPDTDELGTCEQTCIDTLAMTGLGGGPDSRYSLALAPTVNSDDDTVANGDRGDLLQCRAYHAVQALGGASGSQPQPDACEAAFGAAPCQ